MRLEAVYRAGSGERMALLSEDSGRTHQRPRLGRCGAAYGLSSFRRSSSGSLTKLTAMRRASSRVSRLAAERRAGSSSKLEVAECLPGGVPYDEARVVVLLDDPRRQEAASGGAWSDDSGRTHQRSRQTQHAVFYEASIAGQNHLAYDA